MNIYTEIGEWDKVIYVSASPLQILFFHAAKIDFLGEWVARCLWKSIVLHVGRDDFRMRSLIATTRKNNFGEKKKIPKQKKSVETLAYRQQKP